MGLWAKVDIPLNHAWKNHACHLQDGIYVDGKDAIDLVRWSIDEIGRESVRLANVVD